MSHEPDEFDLPPGISTSLRAAYTHRGVIPSGVDDAVLSDARRQFEARRRTRMVIRWGTGLATGLAAAIALAVFLHRPIAPAKTFAKGDLNADGRVDMVDALLLARHVAGSDKPEASWDTNADGRVDQKDIDALAAAAVALTQSSQAQRSLPKLHDLGLDRVHSSPVGLGSASGIFDTPNRFSLAKASPTKMSEKEAHP